MKVLTKNTQIPPTAAIVTISQTIVYIFYAAFPHALTAAYQFSPYELGLAFLPLMVGSLLSLPVLSVMQKRRMKEGSGRPEMIMEAAFVGSITMPIGLYWYVTSASRRDRAEHCSMVWLTRSTPLFVLTL
jgi:hypothetical protein